MEDPEPGYVKSKKELKREEKARARRMREEEKKSFRKKRRANAKAKKLKSEKYVPAVLWTKSMKMILQNIHLEKSFCHAADSTDGSQ